MKSAHTKIFAFTALVGLLILSAASAAKLQDAAGQGTSPDMKDALTVEGRLEKAMAVGAETSGWMIELDMQKTIEGKVYQSIEVSYAKPKKLEKLAGQHVKAHGKLTHVHGVETGDRLVLEITDIHSSVGK